MPFNPSLAVLYGCFIRAAYTMYGTNPKNLTPAPSVDFPAPPRVTGAERTVIAGSPDQAHISTSHIERQNLTMRMSMRRFTRLTNAFSKKFENLQAAVALHFAHYNLVRLHKTLRVTPAMAADVTDRVWSLEELVDRTSR